MENIEKFVGEMQEANQNLNTAADGLADELTGLINKLYDKGVTIYTDPDCDIAITGVIAVNGKLFLGTEWSSDLE